MPIWIVLCSIELMLYVDEEFTRLLAAYKNANFQQKQTHRLVDFISIIAPFASLESGQPLD
mgnify:CR=1 FL=1